MSTRRVVSVAAASGATDAGGGTSSTGEAGASRVLDVTSVAVLDSRGHARLGLVGASGPIGHEQYAVGAWRFERVMHMPSDLKQPRTEAEAAEDAAEEAERAVTAARRAELEPAPAPPEGGSGEDAGSGSGEEGSGEPSSGGA